MSLSVSVLLLKLLKTRISSSLDISFFFTGRNGVFVADVIETVPGDAGGALKRTDLGTSRSAE